MKKKNYLRTGIIVVVIAVVGFVAVRMATAKPAPLVVSYVELYQDQLINSISAKGSVESVNKTNVYSTLGLTIDKLNVEVGDKVTEGQVLCVLDIENLELDLQQRKADLNQSQKNSLNQLESSQRTYNEAASNLRNGTNSQLVSAESSLKTAELNLEKAQKDYADAKADYNNNTQVQNAESSLNTAKIDLDIKKTAYEKNTVLYNAGGISKETFTQSEDAFISAENRYNDALLALENAKTNKQRAFENAETSLKSAETNYNNAVKSKNSAINSAKQEVDRYQSNVESAQIATNVDSALIAIQKLEKQLADSVIKAPVSGTITAAYPKEGALASGLMFVIEDTEKLKVTTRFKEYDVSKIETGMPVTIKSDSTGDIVYDGHVSKVNPAANKDASGETSKVSDIEFGAEVLITSANTDLRIGMETRLTVVFEKKDNVYSVPYDAIFVDDNGDSVIYLVVSDGQDGYIAKRAVVTTGMETDFYVEISGSDLYDGVKVINDSSSVTDGMKITLQ